MRSNAFSKSSACFLSTPTTLAAISELSSAQAHATKATKQACQQFLNYTGTHPDVIICYKASDMILKLHSYSNSAYLSASGSCS